MLGVLPPRPLAKEDDRLAFDCGRASINAWFHRHAWNNHSDDASRVNVICDADTCAIIGYVTLSASQIERAFLPKSQQRNRPDPIPVALLGQLAIHKDHQQQGHAKSLLQFALKTSLRAAEIVGIVGVITHPIDDGEREFYARWHFQELSYDPRRAMWARFADLRKSGMTVE